MVFINYNYQVAKEVCLPQAVKERQYGRVTSTELVQAVHDMLSAAGINIDAEKQSLLQTTLTLQEQVKESQVALLVEQVCPWFPDFVIMERLIYFNITVVGDQLNS